MDLNEMNENWQKEAPTLAAMEKTNPFKVPDNYFEGMSEQLRNRITISEFDNNETLFTVPENYFETLTDKITSITALEELKQPDSKIFTVPDNYFITLEERIAARLPLEKEVSTPKIRRIFSSWSTYAAAACLTAVISVGVFLNIGNGGENIQSRIAQLPADEIENYLQLYSDAGDAAMIVNTLGTGSEISELVPEVSEQEIEKYLEQNL
jgi:hypothetical protein